MFSLIDERIGHRGAPYELMSHSSSHSGLCRADMFPWKQFNEQIWSKCSSACIHVAYKVLYFHLRLSKAHLVWCQSSQKHVSRVCTQEHKHFKTHTDATPVAGKDVRLNLVRFIHWRLMYQFLSSSTQLTPACRNTQTATRAALYSRGTPRLPS